ncbi:MAG: hypothetical protein L3J28_03580 [Candidatus Polarisedimenticolaceae bacterium]|nr:hypothetical protein [Candidatus Polarisedimenticolaceae bacterium]
MKKFDVTVQHGWLLCLVLLLLLLCILALALNFQSSSIFSDIGLWFVSLLAGVVAIFCIAFALLYGALLLCFPKKPLVGGRSVDVKCSQRDRLSSVDTVNNGARLRPISNPYERVSTS